jgi:hypothetical protein
MFRAPSRPSSGAYNCTRSLWFYRLERGSWSAVGRGLASLPDHDQRGSNCLSPNGKTRGSPCSCMLLTMGGKAPETCWATHKRQVINLWKCCILLVDLFKSYGDAWTWERQILVRSLVPCGPPLNHNFIQYDRENVCQPSGGYSLVYHASKLLS